MQFSVDWSTLRVAYADIETAKATVAEKLQDATNKRADADAAKAVKDKETREAKAAAKSR